MVLLTVMVMKTVASNLWHDALFAIINLFFMFSLSSVDFKKPSVSLPVSICYCDCSAVIIVPLFPAHESEKIFKENISWHDTTGRSRETAWLAFFKCVIPSLFFCLYSRCVLTSKEMFHLSWAALDSVTSFSLVLHSCIAPQRAFGAWKSAFKSYIILLFSIFPVSMAHLPLMSLPSSRHIFCFCIRRGNNSDGRRDLPAALLIIHHSLFVATIRSGWVSSSNLRI